MRNFNQMMKNLLKYFQECRYIVNEIDRIGLRCLIGQIFFRVLIDILLKVVYIMNIILLDKINHNSKRQLFKFLEFLYITKRILNKNHK